MKTPQSADQKPLIVKKSKALATKYNSPILMTTTKAPSEKRISGSDNNCNAGFIREFVIPKSAPAFMRFIKDGSKVIPETSQAATEIAIALLMI